MLKTTKVRGLTLARLSNGGYRAGDTGYTIFRISPRKTVCSGRVWGARTEDGRPSVYGDTLDEVVERLCWHKKA